MCLNVLLSTLSIFMVMRWLSLSSLLLTRDIVEELVEAVAVNGSLVVDDQGGLGRLVWLARAYARAVKAIVNHVLRGVPCSEAYKAVYNLLPDYVYLETACKNARLVMEGLKSSNGSRCEIESYWISSRGNRAHKGNKNIKLVPREDHFDVLIRYPWDGTWIKAKAYFGERYIGMLRELLDLAERRLEGYGVTISFKNRPRIHVQVPTWLYLKHMSGEPVSGKGFIAGIDVNSDRVNLAVVDLKGSIVHVKGFGFPEVTRPGYPEELARQKRLKAIAEALKIAREAGASVVAFENLPAIKGRRFTSNPNANRKISRFAKRQYITHGILKAFKVGFEVVILVEPAGTTNSEEHDKAMREHGLDKHTASAYVIALRGLKELKEIDKNKAQDNTKHNIAHT
jgi:predicted transposase